MGTFFKENTVKRISIFWGGLPPPDLTYRIPKIRLADATYLIAT